MVMQIGRTDLCLQLYRAPDATTHNQDFKKQIHAPHIILWHTFYRIGNMTQKKRTDFVISVFCIFEFAACARILILNYFLPCLYFTYQTHSF